MDNTKIAELLIEQVQTGRETTNILRELVSCIKDIGIRMDKLESHWTFDQKDRFKGVITDQETCIGCHGKGGWFDGDEGQFVVCMNCENAYNLKKPENDYIDGYNGDVLIKKIEKFKDMK